MTKNHEPAPSLDDASPGAWTTPHVRRADEIDAELHRLADALGLLRHSVGPTTGVNDLSTLIQSLVAQAQKLRPDQRRQAVEYLRGGMNLRSALLIPVLLDPGTSE